MKGRSKLHIGDGMSVTVYYDGRMPVGLTMTPPRGGTLWQCFHGKRRSYGHSYWPRHAFRQLKAAWEEAKGQQQ